MTRGLSLLPYGDEGVGKTSFCLQFPKPLYCFSIGNEHGYENLEMVSDIPDGCTNINITSYNQLLKNLVDLPKCSTIVIDSVSGLSDIFKQDILRTRYKEYNNPEQAYASFSEGDRQHMPDYCNELCNRLTLLNNRGIHTLLIGHARIEDAKNVNGHDYKTKVLDMEKWSRAVLVKWAAAVLFMTLDAEVVATKEWKKKVTEAKVQADVLEDSDRIMYTCKHLSHSAKNLLKLPPYISLGESAEEAYNRFVSKLPSVVQENLL